MKPVNFKYILSYILSLITIGLNAQFGDYNDLFYSNFKHGDTIFQQRSFSQNIEEYDLKNSGLLIKSTNPSFFWDSFSNLLNNIPKKAANDGTVVNINIEERKSNIYKPKKTLANFSDLSYPVIDYRKTRQYINEELSRLINSSWQELKRLNCQYLDLATLKFKSLDTSSFDSLYTSIVCHEIMNPYNGDLLFECEKRAVPFSFNFTQIRNKLFVKIYQLNSYPVDNENIEIAHSKEPIYLNIDKLGEFGILNSATIEFLKNPLVFEFFKSKFGNSRGEIPISNFLNQHYGDETWSLHETFQSIFQTKDFNWYYINRNQALDTDEFQLNTQVQKEYLIDSEIEITDTWERFDFYNSLKEIMIPGNLSLEPNYSTTGEEQSGFIHLVMQTKINNLKIKQQLIGLKFKDDVTVFFEDYNKELTKEIRDFLMSCWEINNR